MFSGFGYISSVYWQLVFHSPLAFKVRIYRLRAPHSWKTTRLTKQQQNREQQHPTNAVKHQVCSHRWNSCFMGGSLGWSPACLEMRDQSNWTREHAHLSSHKVPGNDFLHNSRTPGSPHSLPHSFSSGLCTQAVVSKTFSNHADAE